jgi:hypothetical protein
MSAAIAAALRERILLLDEDLNNATVPILLFHRVRVAHAESLPTRLLRHLIKQSVAVKIVTTRYRLKCFLPPSASASHLKQSQLLKSPMLQARPHCKLLLILAPMFLALVKLTSKDSVLK